MPSLSIQELTGSRRSVTLGGRSLPEYPFPAGTDLRHKVTYYAGNNVATLQVLGSEERETTVNGRWSDRYISGTVTASGFDTPTYCTELVKIFEELARSGNALRVQWNDIVRMGILAEFEPKWLRTQDVEFMIRFVWYGRDDEEVSRATPDVPPNSAELRTRQNAVDDQLAFEPKAVRPDYAAEVRERISTVRGRVSSVFDRVREAQSSALIPITATRGLLADAEAIRLEGNELTVNLIEAPLEIATYFESLIERLQSESWRREEGRRGRRLQAEGVRVARQLASLTRPAPLAVVTARGGDSLRRLAQVYYGSADEWRIIADVNDLPDSNVTPGTLLVIPPQSSAREGSDAC